MKKPPVHSILILLVILCTGCSQSLLYSPALHLSEKPLAEKEVEIKGGIGLLPETRPLDNLDKTTPGGSLELGYGFTNSFSLYASGWTDLEDFGGRSGYALSSRLSLAQGTSYEVVTTPRVAMLLDGGSINGYGFELPVTVLLPFSPAVYSYVGAGFAYGVKEFEKQTNNNNEQLLPQGFGVIGHVGFGWNISNEWRLTGEVCPLYQINTFDEHNDFILSPGLSVGYTFGR